MPTITAKVSEKAKGLSEIHWKEERTGNLPNKAQGTNSEKPEKKV